MAPSGKSSGRNAQLARILRILGDLDRLGGVDLYELAERYGTAVRTIRRDMDALHDAGLPLVYEEDGKRKRWRVDFKHPLRQVSRLLDATHYTALRLAVGQGGAVRHAEKVFATLEDLADKIEQAVGESGRDRLRAIDRCFHSYEKYAYAGVAPDILWPVIEAIIAQEVCEVVYRTPNKKGATNTFEVLPLRIFTHAGTAYIMCLSTKYESYITLSIARVQQWRTTKTTRPPPADFNPSVLESTAFGVYTGGPPTTYVLRFRPELAAYIRERVWHPSQSIVTHDDGGLTLSFSCGGSYEVTAWVASWRDGVEVLAPDSLRSELGKIGAWFVGVYGKGRV